MDKKNVNQKGSRNSNEGGFLQIIILIIIALLIMKYSGLTISGVWAWFLSFFAHVLQ